MPRNYHSETQTYHCDDFLSEKCFAEYSHILQIFPTFTAYINQNILSNEKKSRSLSFPYGKRCAFCTEKNKTGKKTPQLSGYVKYDRSNPEHIEDSIALVKAITDAPIVTEGHVGLGNIDSYEPCVRDRAGNCYNSQIIEVTKVYKGEGIQAGDLLEMHLQKDCKIYTEPIGYDMRYKQYYCWEDYYYHSQDISLFFLHKSEMPINIKNQPIKTTVNYFSQCPISFIRDRMRNLRFETHDNFLTYFYSYPWVKKYLKKKSKKNQK